MDSKREIVPSKKVKKFCFIAIGLIVVNHCAGIYYHGYPSGLVLSLAIMTFCCILNYILLFRFEKLGFNSEFPEHEKKRLKIELACTLVVIGTLCSVFILQQKG